MTPYDRSLRKVIQYLEEKGAGGLVWSGACVPDADTVRTEDTADTLTFIYTTNRHVRSIPTMIVTYTTHCKTHYEILLLEIERICRPMGLGIGRLVKPWNVRMCADTFVEVQLCIRPYVPLPMAPFVNNGPLFRWAASRNELLIGKPPPLFPRNT